MPNIYYNPEEFGLTLVSSIDKSDGNYCFDYFYLWREDSTGRYFYATDSGCSCPSPFENYHSIEDLTEIRTKTELKNALDSWLGEPLSYYSADWHRARQEANDLIFKFKISR